MLRVHVAPLPALLARTRRLLGPAGAQPLLLLPGEVRQAGLLRGRHTLGPLLVQNLSERVLLQPVLQDCARGLRVQQCLGAEIQAALAVQPRLEGRAVEAGPRDEPHRGVDRREALVPKVDRRVGPQGEQHGVRKNLREMPHQFGDLALRAIRLIGHADDHVLHAPGARHLRYLDGRVLPVSVCLQRAHGHRVRASQGEGQADKLRPKVNAHRSASVCQGGLEARSVRLASGVREAVLDAQGVLCVVRPVLEVLAGQPIRLGVTLPILVGRPAACLPRRRRFRVHGLGA
mmetsp:Transcript_67743/g.201520  ORF Transcript_67743/g.201520 Transcript_67743/m.201520 type:complete len:289 (-) Transcript_67743:220-1086(-)